MKGVFMTWTDLIKLEPFLKTLYYSALQNQTHDDALLERLWYLTFKPVISYIVGYESIDPALRTCQAYDIVYDVIFQALQGNKLKNMDSENIQDIRKVAAEIHKAREEKILRIKREIKRL